MRLEFGAALLADRRGSNRRHQQSEPDATTQTECGLPVVNPNVQAEVITGLASRRGLC